MLPIHFTMHAAKPAGAVLSMPRKALIKLFCSLSRHLYSLSIHGNCIYSFVLIIRDLYIKVGKDFREVIKIS